MRAHPETFAHLRRFKAQQGRRPMTQILADMVEVYVRAGCPVLNVATRGDGSKTARTDAQPLPQE